MLVLSAVEFVFFTVAGMGLCFGVVLNIDRVDNADTLLLLLVRDCTEPRPHLGGDWGYMGCWKGTQP